ncbi:isoleucine--tRNA ligase [Candidatus Woesearchaeota archaeon]|nr:isoleucine--tRNA ligase [Candidatus Woesearchaeota archaeon]
MAANEKSKASSGPGPYNFKQVEERVIDFWNKKDIYSKAKERNKGKKVFYFLDGPPYTSGKVHIGTAWNKALKDCFLRYKRMAGFDAWDRAGYDMHGLPTEHATEKKLSIKNKDEIHSMGVAKFIEECRNLSVENMESMNEDFKRLGVWMDFENAYQSIKDEFIEGEWWLIKKAHENKRLYKGKKTMHWCRSCATALAKHELEYKEIRDTSIFFKFKVIGSENEYLIVWTTTPWTLAFNLAVMVNPEIDYVRAEVEGEKGKEIWILAKALAGPVVQAVAEKKLKVTEEFKGEELEGLKYEHPWLDDIPSMKELKDKNEKVHTVVLSKEYVDVSAGSGLVHCAPGCGPEDYEVGHREGIPAYNEIDEAGKYPDSMGRFSGLTAKKDDPKFIEALEEKGALIAKTPVEHDYAHCWRCHNPVVFKTTTQWFFRIEDLTENMKELNKDIGWVPDWAGSRQFHSWLDNLRDNSITKQRFWGCPLPVWYCGDQESKDGGETGCGDYIVIGDKEELKQKAGRLPEDLHKPWIDEITIKCDKCGKDMKRIPDILDVWVDAGCASWICLDFPRREDLFKKMFPADFILEGKDQIRGWFNLLFVASMVSMEKPSFRNVYMHGYVNDAQGRKMSKSLGNYIVPEEVISKYGADAFRYYSIGGTNAGLDLNYNFDDVKTKHRHLGILWNLQNFLLDMKRQNIIMAKEPKLSVEEKYILSKMNTTIKDITQKFEAFKLDEIPSLAEELFLDLSRTYIQLVRDKASLGTDVEKGTVMRTINDVLMVSLKIMAPVAPFITESIYQNLKKEFKLKEASVHHLDWPSYDEKMINSGLEESFDVVKQAIQSILSAREKAQLGLRWPLRKVHIITRKPEVEKAVKDLGNIIKNQANVKELAVEKDMPGVDKKIRADYAKLGPDFGEDTTRIIAQFSMMSADSILSKIEEQGYYDMVIDGDKFRLKRNHLIVDKETPENIAESDFRYGELYIDKERTPELDAEGFAREVMRHAQQMRKEAGMQKQDSIDLHVQAEDDLAAMLDAWKDAIKEKVGAKKINISSSEEKHAHSKEVKVKSKKMVLGFEKV